MATEWTGLTAEMETFQKRLESIWGSHAVRDLEEAGVSSFSDDWVEPELRTEVRLKDGSVVVGAITYIKDDWLYLDSKPSRETSEYMEHMISKDSIAMISQVKIWDFGDDGVER